ncbi:MAG: acetolactate synthase small subunit [Leptospiraceae bacterium]|jgi:acetolactate synthase-1/3 small subunit|nr:acetolactate synthase small subunit [Leptospiraceae bacterium]MBK7054916.1 acetolactate synthase small subunit [Leptospiraceae bacterium]MBK9501345.1 acetolactate synthase small subunit [Leptospiraceae bacterium]MBL0266881.1 acetolactate synthase small subunit [Leptospiraceae bacterium]MBP9165427.1 acetolactate synthase small subunit [Leptospiraceae bacterium]
MKHTLNILVNNHPGVMSHVSGLFTRRSYNIDSIAVGVTENPDISSMTIVLKGDDAVVDQVKQQLLKLPDVLKVTDLFYMEAITRELVLLKVEAKDSNRTEIISLCGVFGSKIVDVTDTSLMIEFSGSARQVAAFITMMTKYGILEMARTGQIALACQNG